MTGLVLCDDLIFFSRISATAVAAGLSVRQARAMASAIALATASPPGGVLIDLHTEGLDVPKLLAELQAVCAVMPRTIAFGSHVDVERLKAAREAGIERVLPRSQFVKDLETKLTEWFTPT